MRLRKPKSNKDFLKFSVVIGLTISFLISWAMGYSGRSALLVVLVVFTLLFAIGIRIVYKRKKKSK